MIRLLISYLFLSLSSSTYIPPYYEGTPADMSVVSLNPPDFTGEPVYRIQFSLETRSGSSQSGFIHRSWGEFEEFQHHLDTDIFLNPGMHLPDQPSVENLNEYLQKGLHSSRLMKSHILHDFLGINWSGSDLKFFENLEEFMKLVVPQLYRVPVFHPEPPIFDNEDDAIVSEECPFEVYAYVKGFRASSDLQAYQDFFKKYLDTNPTFSGPEDNSDVQPVGTSIEIPPHFNQTFVHFLPGGYLNGHTVRISYLGKDKFNFLNEDNIFEFLQNLHGDKNPKRILDIGTGPGFSAFALHKLFPDAEIIGVDLAAPYIRFARRWQELRNVSNISFYQGNAEDLSWMESGSIDLINYAYVVHEMPAPNALNVVSEMYRLLREGGTMNGFDVPYEEDPIMREIATDFNTWGHQWDTEGPKGPEPYMSEYEWKFALPNALADAGFTEIEAHPHTFFESIYLATK